MIVDILSILALLILLTIAVIAVIVLGGLPGRIAEKRGHPYAQAVKVAGWVGVFTLGIIWPLALIWAFVNKMQDRPGSETPQDADKIAQLAKRIDVLEATLREHGRPS